MEYSLKYICKKIVLVIIITGLLILAYNIGNRFCLTCDIPPDFILPTSGIPCVFGMTIWIFIIEVSGMFHLIKLLGKLLNKSHFNKFLFIF